MLDHTFITGASALAGGTFNPGPAQQPAQRPVVQQPVQRPIPTRRPDAFTQPAPVPQSPTSQPAPVSYEGFECGNPDYMTPTSTALVIGGQVARRGQFPW